MTYHVLAMLSIMELAERQSLTQLMSDWSRRQSCGELVTENFDIFSKDYRFIMSNRIT
jgi:hypothetical protein